MPLSTVIRIDESLEDTSFQSLSHVWLFATPWTAARQASLSITNSRSLPRLMSIESVMPSNHLILCRPLLLLPSIFPSIRVFSNELAFRIRWPKYWSFSFNIGPSNEHPGLISFRMDWLDLLAVQGTPESSPTPQFKSINSSALSFLYSPTLTSIHDHWKNHSLDQMDLSWQSNVSAFSKTSLNIWKFMFHILLKPSLENFEHHFTSMWDECNYAVVWAFFEIKQRHHFA